MATRLRNIFSVLLLFVFSYHIAHAASLKIPNYGTGGSGFSKTVNEKLSDLIFKNPKLGNKNSSVEQSNLFA